MATRRPEKVSDCRGRALGRREPEGRVSEVQREQFLGRGAGVQQQVATGDAHLDRAGADVDSDVPRPQEEELRIVVRVGEDELTAVGPLPVTRLVQHRRGRLGQQPLVGYRDP